MKKTEKGRTREFIPQISRIKLRSKEKKALQAAVKAMEKQSEQLGLLDPMEAEPAVLFFAEEGKR